MSESVWREAVDKLRAQVAELTAERDRLRIDRDDNWKLFVLTREAEKVERAEVVRLGVALAAAEEEARVAREALKGTLEAMRMQLLRESGAFHLAQEPARALWDEAMAAGYLALDAALRKRDKP